MELYLKQNFLKKNWFSLKQYIKKQSFGIKLDTQISTIKKLFKNLVLKIRSYLKFIYKKQYPRSPTN